MQTGLQPLQQQCGIALLPSRSTRRTATLLRRVQAFNARSSRVSIRCCSSDTETQQQPNFPARTLLGLALAATLSIGSLTSTQAALAKTNPVKKADPYEDLQKIINSRGGNNTTSLFDSFKKQAEEAAKIPAEIIKAPTEVFKAQSVKAPAVPLPLPITKALPQPASQAIAGKSEPPSVGLLAGVGAVVLAVVAAIGTKGNSKAPAKAPSPNKIKAKVKGGTKQVSKQASKPSFSLPSLGGKAQQVGKTAKVKAGSASQKASFSLPSLGGKAKQVGKTAKVKAGSAPQKIGFSLPSLGGKAKQVGKTAQVKAGTASTKAKQATPKGIFGTSSTRGKSSSPAKGGGPLGTRSTRPASGGTQKVKLPPPSRSVAAAKKAVSSGGKSLVDEDTGSTIGAFGVVALAVAVGGLTLSSITSSIGGGSASKAPAEVKQLLDRVPEPLPVAKRAQQAATQVSSKVQDAVPQSAPTLKSPPSIPSPKDFQPPPVPSPKDTLPPIAQTPQTPSGPDLVPELMQKPKTGTPLAPPPSDATKPKIPSGPDLRVPETPSPSLGMTPQLANGPPPSPAKAADKVAKKASEAVPQLAEAPKAAQQATKKVAEATPQIAQEAPAPVPGPSGGNPLVLVGLAAVVVGGVVFAKQTQPESDSQGTGTAPRSPAPSSNGASASAGKAPQSADEAAADAKTRAKEAREWIDSWKSKQ